jgi:hypothetical protein
MLPSPELSAFCRGLPGCAASLAGVRPPELMLEWLRFQAQPSYVPAQLLQIAPECLLLRKLME